MSTGSAGNAAGAADVLDIRCGTGTENDDADLANFEFPHVASRAPPLLLENFKKMLASKASLCHCETTVVSRVKSFQVALAEKGSLELQPLAQGFLATERRRFELSVQTHLNWRIQTVVCCLTCHVSVSTMGVELHEQIL